MSGPEVALLVPARLASVRFPEKLLHPIAGRPLILHTAERIAEQTPDIPLWFAVDSPRLAEPLSQAGFATVLTDPDLPSGTDRLAAANREVGAQHVINIQADEPEVRAEHILRLREMILSGDCDMATLAWPFQKEDDFRNPARVKVVLSASGHALYFSRAPIPFNRDGEDSWAPGQAFLHLGMYAYTNAFLTAYAGLPPGKLEQLERLEQLRALEHGYRIRVAVVNEAAHGIDTPADAEAYLRRSGAGNPSGNQS